MLRVFANLDEVSRAAADELCRIGRGAVDQRGRFTIALAGGSTPRRLYENLAAEPYRSRVDWTRVEFFWGDEREVPPEDESSNFRRADETMLRPLAVPPARIHRIAAEREDLAAAARDYEAETARG